LINNSYTGEESESADNIELKDIVNHVIDGDTLVIDDIIE
jgi:hypoxanthine-guanine phosphoribosyltransferase